MKSAISTVSWGTHVVDFDDCCRAISGFGVQGIELGQHPDYLDIKTGKELKSILDSHGIHLAGMAFGSLEDRLRFCGDAIRPDYMYVDHWNEDLAAFAARQQLTLALHPHAFKKIKRDTDFSHYLHAHPSLQLILDTAHAKILQIDQLSFVDRFKDRLAAVHLKEWCEDYGRTVHKYFEGFQPLGEDKESQVGALIDLLISRKFAGWLVIEHSGVENMQSEFLARSVRFLSTRLQWATAPKQQPELARSLQPNRSSAHVASPLKHRITRCRETLLSLNFRSNATFFTEACNALQELVGCKFTSIWSVNNGEETVGCLAWSPIGTEPVVETVLSFNNSYGAQTTIENKLYSCHDLSDPNIRGKFAQKETLGRHPDIRYLHTFPVYSPGNLLHARYLISFLASNEMPQGLQSSLIEMAALVGRVAAMIVDARARELVAEAVRLWAKRQDSTHLFNELAGTVRNRIPCEGVTIFLPGADDDGNIHLYPRGTTGIFWRTTGAENFYRKGVGLTGIVWERGDVMFSQSPSEEHRCKGKSSEEVASTDIFSTLWIPILHSGECVGVIRCRNRVRNGIEHATHTFSDDDSAVLITLCETLAPYLVAMIDTEMNQLVLKRLSHEVRNPFRMILSAVADIEDECRQRKLLGAQPWLNKMKGAIVYAMHVVQKVDSFRESSDIESEISSPFQLQADVLTPLLAKICLIELDVARRLRKVLVPVLSKDVVIHGNADSLAACLFHALWNAGVFCVDEKIELRIEALGSVVQIHIEDYGVGISQNVDPSLLFLEGTRGGNASDYDQNGHGLGLWIIQKTLVNVGGSASFTSLANPTRLTLLVPQFWKNRTRRLQ